ncbi:MAG: ribosome silencing factor [Candidatus Omnitrophica bacterium 4484_171]|nr:MAG: ribosome silencing factor [Candidatus Omnitrophica bacterium 4484_171]
MAAKKKVTLGKTITGKEKALKILSFALGKKAQDPIIIDIRSLSHFCDYFILCSGTSQRHARAIYEEVIKSSKKNKIGIHHCENDSSSSWLLVDYYDIIMHIFTEESREFYGIERLWREAKRIRIPKKVLGNTEFNS